MGIENAVRFGKDANINAQWMPNCFKKGEEAKEQVILFRGLQRRKRIRERKRWKIHEVI